MQLAELAKFDAYQGLEPGERRLLADLLGADLHVDGSALDQLDGEPGGLSAEDLRAWLLLARQQAYPFVSSEAASPESGKAFAALLAALPRTRRGPARVARILDIQSLATLLGAAERARSGAGIHEQQLAAIERQRRTLRRSVKGFDLDRALERGGFRELAKELATYRKSRRGFRRWLGDALRLLVTTALNLRAAWSWITTGFAGHEGLFRGGRWRNWNEECRFEPRLFVQPGSEREICDAVRAAEQLRAVGGGHSFNESPCSNGTLLSLDRYNHLDIDVQARTCRVQAGMRLRDLNRVLAGYGLALPVLGSTDAQSIAGLVSTDLHGTGKNHGFLSEQILSLRIVDATGTARTVRPGEPLFHAAIGGLGTVGVVTEVELSVVPAFRLRKVTSVVDRAWAEQHIDQILERHDHVSFYYPAWAGAETRSIRMHTWSRTNAPLDAEWKAAITELTDFALSGFLAALVRRVARAPAGSWLTRILAPQKEVVAPSHRAFGRRLFYRHDEIEFGVPFEGYRQVLAETLARLEKHRRFSIVEVRFTPATSQALIGPGVGRRTVYIELATAMNQSTSDLYEAVEAVFVRHRGQPHLGKKTSLRQPQMKAIFGQRFEELVRVRREQDPDGKFANDFTRQLF